MDEHEEDLVYVCQSCGHEDFAADKFGQFCLMCGTDLDELEDSI